MGRENNCRDSKDKGVEGEWKHNYDFLVNLTAKINAESNEGLSMEEVEAVLSAINYPSTPTQEAAVDVKEAAEEKGFYKDLDLARASVDSATNKYGPATEENIVEINAYLDGFLAGSAYSKSDGVEVLRFMLENDWSPSANKIHFVCKMGRGSVDIIKTLPELYQIFQSQKTQP